MATIQDRSTLKGYFRKGLCPTEDQFAQLIDSLRHQHDHVPAELIDGLSNMLNRKADVSQIADIIEGYLGEGAFNEVLAENVFDTNYPANRAGKSSCLSQKEINSRLEDRISGLSNYVDQKAEDLKGELGFQPMSVNRAFDIALDLPAWDDFSLNNGKTMEEDSSADYNTLAFDVTKGTSVLLSAEGPGRFILATKSGSNFYTPIALFQNDGNDSACKIYSDLTLYVFGFPKAGSGEAMPAGVTITTSGNGTFSKLIQDEAGLQMSTKVGDNAVDYTLNQGSARVGTIHVPTHDGTLTAIQDKQTTDSARITSEVTARTTADTQLLQRIQGKSSESRALDDPFIWLGEFNDTITDGAVTESGTEAFGQYAMDMLLNNDYLKYVGHGRAMVTGTNQDIWTYFMGTRTAEYTDGTYELKFFAQKTRGRYGANALGNLALSDDHDILEAERKVTVKRFVDGSPAVIESVSAWADSGATVKDLGVFNSTSEVMAAAAKVGIVRDYRIAMMVARVNTSDNSKKSSIAIHQQITANSDGTYTTWQYIFEKNQRYTRYIESNATAVTAVQSVQKDGVRNLEYGQLGYLKLTDMHGSQVGTSVHMKAIDQSALREESSTTSNVRLVQTKTFGNTNEVLLTPATSAKAGVMTAAMYEQLRYLIDTLGVTTSTSTSANQGSITITTQGLSPGSTVDISSIDQSGHANLSQAINLGPGDTIEVAAYCAILISQTTTTALCVAYGSNVSYTNTSSSTQIIYIYNEAFPLDYDIITSTGMLADLQSLSLRLSAIESRLNTP